MVCSCYVYHVVAVNAADSNAQSSSTFQQLCIFWEPIVLMSCYSSPVSLSLLFVGTVKPLYNRRFSTTYFACNAEVFLFERQL